MVLHLDNDDEEDSDERRSSAMTDAVVLPRVLRATLREDDDAPRSATTDAVVLSLLWRRALAWRVDVVGAWSRRRRAVLLWRRAREVR